MSEKLCLRWNDFQENVFSAFESLRADKDFTDVTLVCADSQQLESHKVILAASSPFFQKLLRTNKHSHPMVYMRGMKSEDMVAILDFLYYGEASILQENLDSFLAIADELQVKGLMGTKNEGAVKEENHQQVPKQAEPKKKLKDAQRSSINPFSLFPTDSNVNKPDNIKQISATNCDSRKIVTLPDQFINSLSDLEEMVKSMMEKSENFLPNGQQKGHRCKVCGKEDYSTNIKKHIESNHLEGVSIPCNSCEKTFRSRRALSLHNSQNHE